MRQEYTPLSNDALNAFFYALDDASLRIRFILFLMTDTMRHTLNCKILLPKFNTWEQVLLERKNGFEVPLYSTVSGISAKKICRYGVIALPLHCNGNAITL